VAAPRRTPQEMLSRLEVRHDELLTRLNELNEQILAALAELTEKRPADSPQRASRQEISHGNLATTC
jgi:hypothetical protein